MKKQILLLTVLTTSIISTTWCSQAPQAGYWQRFRNWITDIIEIPQVVRAMRKIENEIKDLPTTDAKLDTLEAMEKSYAPTGDKPDRIAYKAAGRAILYYLEQAVYEFGIKVQNFKKELERSSKLIEQTKGLSKEESIEKLLQLHDMYSPHGSHPDEAMFNDVNELLALLLKNK